MSEAKKPELTPKEQQTEDQERVDGQLIVTDVNRTLRNVMDFFPFGGSSTSGRTSFEGHELNALIDLIENSNPEHLEDAGQALFKARTAIQEASRELGGFIEGVDWEGESGIAFRDWGKGLVAHATKLGEFAQAAGTQITVAGTGLASVRNSLPPRDTRLIRKSVEDIETPARIDGNPEYAAAVKVEKDRQEAINQANRLASYYAVSEESLAAQEPPRFEKMLDVAMPRPRDRWETPPDSGDSSAGSETSGGSTKGVVGDPGAEGESSRSGNAGGHGPVEVLGSVTPVSDRSTSTEINSAAAPPAPVTASGASPMPSSTSPGGPGGGSAPPLASGFMNSVSGNSRRSAGSSGMSKGVGQPSTGLARPGGGSSGSGPAANGRTGGPAGRPAATGGGSGSGTAGRTGAPVGRPGSMGGASGSSGTSGRTGGSGSQPPVAGRPGVTGGRPMAGGHAGASGSSSPRGGRTSGIVGGTPQRAVPGAGAPAGARGVPRGTVVGAEGAAPARGSAGGSGQRGVIGADGASSAKRPGGRGTPSSNGVVGTPRGGAAGTGSGSRGFTAGGAGLVRGPAGRRNSDSDDQETGSTRPDYLTEDEETWAAGRRGTVPPVIE